MSNENRKTVRKTDLQQAIDELHDARLEGKGLDYLAAAIYRCTVLVHAALRVK